MSKKRQKAQSVSERKFEVDFALWDIVKKTVTPLKLSSKSFSQQKSKQLYQAKQAMSWPVGKTSSEDIPALIEDMNLFEDSLQNTDLVLNPHCQRFLAGGYKQQDLPTYKPVIKISSVLAKQSAISTFGEKVILPPRLLDKSVIKNLAQGRFKLQSELDLHNLTQETAYLRLVQFLQKAYLQKQRYVLVITGKGRSLNSQAVLKKAVPHWLKMTPFCNWVSAFSHASERHGGEGALYICLKRRKHS